MPTSPPTTTTTSPAWAWATTPLVLPRQTRSLTSSLRGMRTGQMARPELMSDVSLPAAAAQARRQRPTPRATCRLLRTPSPWAWCCTVWPMASPSGCRCYRTMSRLRLLMPCLWWSFWLSRYTKVRSHLKHASLLSLLTDIYLFIYLLSSSYSRSPYRPCVHALFDVHFSLAGGVQKASAAIQRINTSWGYYFLRGVLVFRIDASGQCGHCFAHICEYFFVKALWLVPSNKGDSRAEVFFTWQPWCSQSPMIARRPKGLVRKCEFCSSCWGFLRPLHWALYWTMDTIMARLTSRHDNVLHLSSTRDKMTYLLSTM